MDRRFLVAAGVLALVTVAAFTLRGKPVGAEKKIRDALAAAATAAEKQDLPGVMALVSERFSGDNGDRNALKVFLLVQLRRGEWRKVFLTNIDVKLGAGAEPTSAEVTLDAVLSAGTNVTAVHEVVPDQAQVRAIALVMENEDGDWRVKSARHRERTLADVLRPPPAR